MIRILGCLIFAGCAGIASWLCSDGMEASGFTLGVVIFAYGAWHLTDTE